MNPKLTPKLQTLLIISIILLEGFSLPATTLAQKLGNPDEEIVTQILGETLQINMTTLASPETGNEKSVLGQSLGSLVQMGGEIVLVTHNHYRDVLQDQTEIEFHDAEDRLIQRISGYEFIDLIIYQDAGTLILHTPIGLSDFQKKHTFLGSAGKVEPGEIVYLTYRQPADRAKVGIQRAVVESVNMQKGLPTYQLRSIDGKPIRGGDSGGGIWHNGQLVGNLWYTVAIKMTEEPVDSPSLLTSTPPSVMVTTDVSIAAVFPLHAKLP